MTVTECGPGEPDNIATRLRAIADLLDASSGIDEASAAQASAIVSLQLIIEEIQCQDPEEIA